MRSVTVSRGARPSLVCFRSIGFTGAFRRPELVALTVTPDGYRVMIRRSKTDQEGEGQEIAIPWGYRIRPVEYVQAWFAASGITGGGYSAPCSRAPAWMPPASPVTTYAPGS
jgi:hypothetical protein